MKQKLLVVPLALVVILMMVAGCHHDPSLNVLDSLPDETLLNIPTYDGSGQCVHPDILLLNPPLNGNRFMLAFTPYPYYNASFENPSVLVSPNGVDFHEMVKGMNPLVPAPPYDHNDDPDLLYDAAHKKYYLHYLQTMRPDSENIIRLESTDGITWVPHYAVHYDLKAGDEFIVSPCTVLQNDGKSYRMYYVSLTDPSGIYKLKTIYSSDGINWDKSNAVYVNEDIPNGWVPWHVDVFHNGTQYVMLCACRITNTESQNEKVMYATSSDGINWHFRQQPLIDTRPDFHKCSSMYRSSGLIQGNTLEVYYSMDDSLNQWWIGVKKFALDTL